MSATSKAEIKARKKQWNSPQIIVGEAHDTAKPTSYRELRPSVGNTATIPIGPS